MKLNWDKIKQYYQKNPVTQTKDGTKFKVGRITNTTLFLALPCGEQPIRRKNLEKAVELISSGTKILTKEDYIRLIKDERSANALAILKDMGFVE